MSARDFNIPTGELREPLVLVRSSREPTGDADWLQTLTPIANAWAKLVYGKQQFIKKVDADPAASHIFWIRDMQLRLGASDYVRHGNDLYAIISTEGKGECLPRFLRLNTMFQCVIDDIHPENQGIIINNTLEPPATDTVEPTVSDNPFWFPSGTPEPHIAPVLDDAGGEVLDDTGSEETAD